MKKRLVIILMLFLSVLFVACKKNNISEDENVVDVFYIDTKTSGLATESYEIIGTETEQQIKELLHMLKNTPENLIYKTALPDYVTILESYFDENESLIINFDSAYSQLTGVPEVLCRAAIVKTLSQIEEVEYIQLNVNGNPLIDSNGEVVGRLTINDFVDSTEVNTNYNVKLYFANKAGDALIEFVTDINSTGTGSMEELVIKQLINGPTELGMYNTIPEGTILLNVWKTDGICYVDFNEKFLEKIPGVNDDIVIYSIVNSLVELSDINKVQFLINNQVVDTLWENMDFDISFERNLELIKETY